MLTIETLNNALKQNNVNVKMSRIVHFGNISIYGYSHELYASERGAYYHFMFFGDGRCVYLKSVLKIVNKHKPYTRLINGQADKNCKDVLWFYDGRGPVVFDNAEGWPTLSMVSHINQLLKAKGETLQIDMPHDVLPRKGDVGTFTLSTFSQGSGRQVFLTLVGDGKKVKLKSVFWYLNNPLAPLEERVKPHYFLDFPDVMPVLV